MNYKDYIASIVDYPKKGIIFRDITTFISNGEVFKASIKDFSNYAKEKGADVIVGPESRGFIFGCPVASELGLGFVPIRKPGKLPRKSVSHKYELEYGENILSVHHDAFKKGDKVLIVDDLLATG
ncbi:MAG: adenine phosphoribosyltransferase, partial [Fusobacterium sp.]